MENNQDLPEEKSVLSLIQEINDGMLNPKTLTQELRQDCVEALLFEGYTEIQIAQILQRSEKTIYRDVQAIRERNSLVPNIKFITQFIGSLVKKGLAHHDYLVRLSNGNSVSDADKIHARTAAWNILNELSERLQTIAYLPLKPKEITGDIYHHQGDDETKTYIQLKDELENIKRIAKEGGALDEGTERKLQQLENRIEKAEILDEIVDLKKNTQNDNEEIKEEKHE